METAVMHDLNMLKPVTVPKLTLGEKESFKLLTGWVRLAKPQLLTKAQWMELVSGVLAGTIPAFICPLQNSVVNYNNPACGISD